MPPAASALRQKLLSGKSIHFSLDAPADLRHIDGAWLREAVLNGASIDIENAVVDGNVNLRGVRLPHDVRIVDTRFEEKTDFSYAEFERTATLTGDVFVGGATFDSARFHSDVWIDRTTFGGDGELTRGGVIFNDAEFAGVVVANGAQFLSTAASFERTRFRSYAYFSSVDFGGPVTFHGMSCDGGLSFAAATFRADVDAGLLRVGRFLSFAGARFRKSAPLSLREIRVEASFSCNGTRFGSSLDLSNSHIGSSLNAADACFFGNTDLSRIFVDGDLMLQGCRCGKKASLVLQSATVSERADFSRVMVKRA